MFLYIVAATGSTCGSFSFFLYRAWDLPSQRMLIQSLLSWWRTVGSKIQLTGLISQKYYRYYNLLLKRFTIKHWICVPKFPTSASKKFSVNRIWTVEQVGDESDDWLMEYPSGWFLSILRSWPLNLYRCLWIDKQWHHW